MAGPLSKVCPKCGARVGQPCQPDSLPTHSDRTAFANHPVERLCREMAALHNLWIWKQDSDDLPHHFRGPLWEALSDTDKSKAITRRRACLRQNLIHIYGVNMSEARPFTKEEGVDRLLKQIAGLAHYWGTVELRDMPDSPLDRCNGLAFSLLSMLDGSNLGFPAIDLYPSVTEEDVEFHKAEGENYYAPGEAINDETHLHELWRNYEIKNEAAPA